MNASGENRARSAWFWVTVLLFLAAIVYIVVSALTGADFLNARDDAPLLILGVANAVSLAGWWRARTGLREAVEAERTERVHLSRMSSERSYQVEKDWRQELHDEVMRLDRERGVLGDPQDVPSMSALKRDCSSRSGTAVVWV
jgi:hypothetical protein